MQIFIRNLNIAPYLAVTFFFFLSFTSKAQETEIELNSIDFVGNDFFDASDLENIILSKETSTWISQFFNSFTSFGNPPSYFDSLIIKDDLEILENYYKAYGFFEANFDAEYSIDSNGSKEASITYFIQENESFNIRDYQMKGLDDLPNDLFRKILDLIEIDTTIQYSEDILETNNTLMINFLQDQGYMTVGSAIPIVKIDTLMNVVDVTIDYSLGKRYRISEVRVEKSGPGENLVSDKLINEIANIKPEKYYSNDELKRAQIRLYRTNLFSSAVITGNLADTSGNYVPVDIITNVGLLNELGET